MRLRCSLAALTAAAAFAAPAASQDVELLAEHYGTPLPPGYVAWRATHPEAFRFAHGRASRMRALMRAYAPRGGAGLTDPLAVLGPREGTVAGTFRIPVLLGLYSDSPADAVPYPRDGLAEAYFGSGPGTVTAYYGEVSGGKVTLVGDVQDWVRGALSQAQTTGGVSGLQSPGRVGDFIVSLLEAEPAIDWGQFDNDGPDGVPNSGDDDGFVDALAVIQPTSGAECGGSQSSNRIWSHKWSLSGSGTGAWATPTSAANGGFIRVDDYFIQPAISCSGVQLNEIGVFTHEAGHAFGLPDLYDTFEGDGKANGAGNWDLMATGAWGCDGKTASTPCHMGAWSKAVLGWVDVQTLTPDADLGTIVLPSVESTQTVLRVAAEDGSGEYFLLENRESLGFDKFLLGTGLLVWQINPAVLAARWASNSVNGINAEQGVWLRQADGKADLQTPGGGRGDAGDPFPYTGSVAGNDAFHAATNPAARSKLGSATGLTLLDIQRVGQDVSFRALTRFTRVTIRSEGDAGGGGLFTVDGAAVAGTSHTYAAAPFEEHQVEALAGEAIDEGKRRPFIEWTDDPGAVRVREVDTPLEDVTLTARYGGLQLELAVALSGGVNGIAPGSILSEPPAEDLWFTENATVTVEAVARRGFGFLAWSGALEGQPNPATITMDVPKQGGADFEITYDLPDASVAFTASEPQDRRLEPDNGNAPYVWTVLSGTLPDGMSLDVTGRLAGSAMVTGSFPMLLKVRDALGLTAQGTITLDVQAPVISAAQLASPFLLTGPTLTHEQRLFLDRQGNRNSNYDLGDFRAWVLANPGLPMTAELRALAGAEPSTSPRPGSGEVTR